ncbi:MAG: GTP-sensing pleiotropic transcriptional regulator CodY [Methylocystaceae bacterium]
MKRSLLERSRSINKILQKLPGNPIDYSEMARVFSEYLECNVYVIGKRGELGGFSFYESTCPEIEQVAVPNQRIPESFNQELLNVQETRTNFKLEGRKCFFNTENISCDCSSKTYTVVPVFSGGRRLGTLVLSKQEDKFSEDDIVLAEYGSILVSNEVMRVRSERIEEEARRKAAVQIALATLSYSEREAIEHILAELNGNEGLLVASRIADEVGITRSVIVSALRKFESAGVIESRSLGMKGTYIKVLNNYVFQELAKN